MVLLQNDMKTNSCIFCSIVTGFLKAAVVYENSSFIAFLDRYPFTLGHTLVIPKKHFEDILRMSETEVGRLYCMVSLIAKAVSKTVKAEGLNIGQNNGRAANQIVPHVHVHIIPRFINQQNMNGRWPSRRPAKDEELEELSEKIKSVLLTADSEG